MYSLQIQNDSHTFDFLGDLNSTEYNDMKDFQILGVHGVIHYGEGNIILFLYDDISKSFNYK